MNFEERTLTCQRSQGNSRLSLSSFYAADKLSMECAATLLTYGRGNRKDVLTRRHTHKVAEWNNFCLQLAACHHQPAINNHARHRHLTWVRRAFTGCQHSVPLTLPVIRRCIVLPYFCTACGFTPRLSRKAPIFWLVLATLNAHLSGCLA